MTNQTYNEESRGVAMNIFAVLGFIAILIAGLWATVQLVKQISNLSFDFNKPTISMPMFGGDDELAIVANTNALNSGEKAEVAWTLGKGAEDDKDSTLIFSYACKAGAYIKVGEAATGTYRAIPCNAPYRLPIENTEISIIPVLTTIETGELAYSLKYTPTEGEPQTARGTLNIVKSTGVAVKPTPVLEKKPVVITTAPVVAAKDGAIVRTLPTPATKTVTVPVKRVVKTTLVPVRRSDSNGLPDLTVKVLEVKSIDANGKVSIKFEIANLGTKLATNWTFTATLPTEPAYTYVSEAQGALYAGERAEMLMTFDKLKTGSNSLLITVDAQNSITESLETNNAVIQTIVGK